MSTISSHTTRAVGTVLTAAIYNFDHVNHVTNAIALNNDKMEGATPPVVDGQMVVWDGTGGNAVRSGGFTPAGPGQVDLAIADGGTGQSTATAAFNALKAGSDATETVNGVVEMATDAEIRAATAGAKAIMAADLETAAAWIALVDAATINFDWDAGINRTITLTANRALGNPSNNQVGTWRTIWILGDGATPRTLTFGGNWVGNTAPIIVTSTTRKLISVLALDATFAFVSSPTPPAGF